ncbi:MAG: glycosyltransferase family 4 protein [Burkholderiaceae bacterium]|nr:glycosyltransferase family 4 protein [Burkholderiaceae bacterium]
MSSHAAITIVSKNYFAFARTLAESYLRHHPDHEFLIVLVDRADGLVPARLDCGAEIIELAAFRLPDIGRMIYRYSIMELNTAVKPFVMADLFERRGYETLLYIDPDIWVFAPLDEVVRSLGEASIVLIPHIRRPYFDDSNPSDTAILQSGTYNLGFLGLRRGASSARLLDWWMSKLHRDCVVDIANGLFVDQKWMDLVPGFFPDHRIVYHPGYNAAYWNLHERPIGRAGGQWQAGGEPLVFFHFSGYLPYAPDTLSKHQDRHRLRDLPALRQLTDAYADALLANGYEISSTWPYAFGRLTNGVTLPLDLVARAMRRAAELDLPVPCPVTEADAFCRFLMSRGAVPERPDVVLLWDVLLELRGDLRKAFPQAGIDSDDAAFRMWLASSGVHEHRIADLMPFEQGQRPLDMVQLTVERLQQRRELGVLDAIGDPWRDPSAFDGFMTWLEAEGVDRLDLPAAELHRLRAARGGVGRILHLYFLRADLQRAYPDLAEAGQRQALIDWLRREQQRVELAPDEISMFEQWSARHPDLLARMRVLYLHRGQSRRSEPNLYDLDSRRFELGSAMPGEALLDWLADEPAITEVDHYRLRFGVDRAPLADFSRVSVPGLEPSRNFAFVKRLRQALAEDAQAAPVINLAGYFSAPTGMGESGRSLHNTFVAADLACRPVTLPHAHSRGGQWPATAAMFGWPAAHADLAVTVANADVIEDLEAFLPGSFWGRHNAGYWVWETEALPVAMARAQRRFDAIWTPSRHSARAIAGAVDRAVHVLPHVLDFDAIDAARPDRARFGLPGDGLVFGFAFDPRSQLERKNVLGLVRAFQAAFRPDDRCWLVLKVNSTRHASFEFDRVIGEAASDRVLVLDGILDRIATFAFLKSLDAYVSLHRAEGFGLTCAEAMACAVPVVASAYSGNLDFMTADNSLLVSTPVVETERPYGPYPAGTRWGDPDQAAAVVELRRLKDEALRRQLGQAGRQSVRAQLHPSVVSAQLHRLVSAALAPSSLPAQDPATTLLARPATNRDPA